MVSKRASRVFIVSIAVLGLSAVVTRPALAAIRLGGLHLAQLAHSTPLLESKALVFCGIAFLSVAFLVRRLRPAEKA